MRRATGIVIAIVAVSVPAALWWSAEEGNSIDSLSGPFVEAGQLHINLASDVADLLPVLPAGLVSRQAESASGLPVSVIVSSAELRKQSLDQAASYLANPNGFVIDVDEEGIDIFAADRNGALYALDELSSMLEANNGQIRSGRFTDAPDHPLRALHLVIRHLKPAQLRELIDRARAARFNTLILQLGDSVVFDSNVVEPRQGAISKDELKELVAYARANGLEVIPQIMLLTHQHKFFKESRPELMYNNRTYDPRQAEVYEYVFEYLDEVIDTIEPTTIDVGHDEVAGSTPSIKKRLLRKGEQVLPPELFLQDVLTLHQYLTDRDIAMWIWGDMLISHEEFPSMHPADFNGINGYNEIRQQLPRDLIVADWHYYQTSGPFTSTATLAEEGFKVVGATWKNNRNIKHFSEQVLTIEPRPLGMVATTWFHGPRQEWDIVNEIIEVSGARFWSAD